MTEFEWSKKAPRSEAAALLRRIADGLDGDGTVALEQESWELKLDVPKQVEIEVELEIGDGETELEIELKWSGPRKAAGESKPAAKAPAKKRS